MSAIDKYAKGEIPVLSDNDVVEINADNQRDTQLSKQNVADGVVDNTLESMAAKRQKAILSFMKMNNQISANEISGFLHVNRRTIQRDIQYLKDKGLIAREGTERGGYWNINKR